jgi:hypothetical protein
LPYTIAPGQRYVTTGPVSTDYYSATEYLGPTVRVAGRDVYYQISFNHRMAFVRAADVTVTKVC